MLAKSSRRESGGRRSPSPGEQIDDALRAEEFVQLETEVVTIRRRRRTMVRGDDDVGRRVVQVRQLAERHPAGPLGVAGPAVRRTGPVAGRAERNVSRRVVADVSLAVGVDEILRRRDSPTQRVGELGPVARLVHFQERRQRPHRRDRARSSGRPAVQSAVVSELVVDAALIALMGVRDQRAVTGDAHGQAEPVPRP